MSLSTITSVVPVSAISSAAAIGRLVVDQVIDTDMDRVRVYWLRKGSKRNPTDCAMLILRRGQPTFSVQFYPGDGAPQFAAELTMDKLPAIVQDLVDAGFPTSRQAVPPFRAADPVALPGATPLLPS